ncbi:zinc finger protein 420-like [Chironomus tepperi]|uniref:zinc finger protein 420-like n=1 Tax=Chironomus tepperi TaxID=113505 RepID=UPI00391F3028
MEDKKKYICPQCGISLSSSYNLRIHTETRCSTEKNHICDICQSRFLTVHSLKTHIKSIHQEKKKFVCSHCGKPFASKGQLTVHERSHNKEKPFICKECGKAFSHRETLVTHSTIHTKIKPYACENCNHTFSCVGNLIKHRKVRPNTCGLPIFTNQKICKRAGVKCPKGKAPDIIVDSSNVQQDSVTSDIQTEIVLIQEEKQELPYDDHQYIVITESQNPSEADIQQNMKDFTKKEMEVFDFMSFDIRHVQEQDQQTENVQEQDQYTENEQKQEPDTENAQEMIVEELIDEPEYLDESFEGSYEAIEETNETDNIIEMIDDEFEILQYLTIDNDQFLCKLCPKIYSKRNISVKHLKKEHKIVLSNFNYDNTNRYRKPQKNQVWKCKYCPKKYTSAKTVERHEKVHGKDGNLIHKCTCCTLYFQTIEDMEDHQFQSHTDRLVCDIQDCLKRFDNPEKLFSHKKYSHSENKYQPKKYSFVCSVCGRNFNTKVALSDHERSDCGANPIYKCEHCERFYHSAGSLKVHMTVHTAELNYQCRFCQKKFRTKGQLTVHNRIHLMLKPFKCKFQDCKAEFAHRESLLTHHTIHTGIKRFECEKCLARFSCLSNLLAHRRSRRKDCSESRIQKVKNAETSLKAV